MMLLALEFSAPVRSVALLERDHPDVAWRLRAARSDSGSRSQGPLALVDALLTEARVPPEAIDSLALSLGPGSYTGIRSAIALAQGWNLAREVPVFAGGTADSLALEAQRLEWFGRVTVGIDAQRNEFYLAEYKIGPQTRELVRPLRLASIDELCASAVPPGVLIGPEVTRWCEAGRVLNPGAEMLGNLVSSGLRPTPVEGLQPIYLRETTFVKAPAPRIILP